MNLAKAGDVNVKITTSTISETRPTYNVIADSPAGRKNRTVVVGAHLDSVVEGPGINDNGSGTSTNLEIALQMAKKGIEPRNRVRFAFWGAEESGLLGSDDYVGKLSDAEKDKIAANLNFDMLGSPNYARLVYDGDGSEDPETGPGPVGSDTIERIFNRHFESKGLATEPTAFDGRSDYGPFIDVGIPAGGLFSGAEELKTAEQQAKFGGTAGLALDPCYHQACDNINNLNKQALDELGRWCRARGLHAGRAQEVDRGPEEGQDREGGQGRRRRRRPARSWRAASTTGAATCSVRQTPHPRRPAKGRRGVRGA